MGREVDDGLRLDDEQISRRHALIRQRGDGALEIEDLGSLNGTWVNDRRINTIVRLQPGDVLRLGATTIEVASPEAPAAAALVAPPAAGTRTERGLAALADWVGRHRWPVIGVWMVILVASAPFWARQSDRLSVGGWSVPGSGSTQVAHLLGRFQRLSSAGMGVLVTGRSSSAVDARVQQARTIIRRHAGLVPAPKPQLFHRGRKVEAILPVSYTVSEDAATELAFTLRNQLDRSTPTTTTRLIGQPALWTAVRDVAKEQLQKGEETGFPLILLILLAGFGTLVAAAAPLVLGFAAVLVTGALIYFLSGQISLSVFVTNMASMIGIGVAVDYSLFIVSRFRLELRRGSREQALRRTLATSGEVVLFSGATVAIALAGLFLIGLNSIRSIAIGAMLVVAIAVCISLTLLPALLAVVGPGVERLRLRLPWRTGGEEGGQLWAAWADVVMARPLILLTAGAAIMLALAWPLQSIQVFNKALTQLPASSTVRQATETARRLTGPGATSPVQLIVTNQKAAAALRARLRTVPGVDPKSLRGPAPSRDGKIYLQTAVLNSDPEGPAARATLQRIERVGKPIASRNGSSLIVGGVTAASLDLRDAILGNLWKIIAFVLTATYVLLFFALRSVLLPLKAVLMNLLSVGAAYGVLVAVFQWGWADWTGYQAPGYVDATVPPLVLAVTFGLSMDYEVFLLTRIREHYLIHHNNRLAVAEGLRASARIITSAALIMVAVFAAFAIAGSTTIRELGVGLAVAVLLDATIVRLLIVPATMRLLGDWNWWMPSMFVVSPSRAPAQ